MIKSISKRKFLMIWGILSLCAIRLEAQTHGGGANGAVMVNFKAGTLIEVAFLSVNPEKQQQLKENYFKKVMPIAKEYGMKPLAKVQVQYTYSEFTKPQIIGFFEWESQAQHQAFLKDPRFLRIKPIRDNALDFLRLGYFEVEKDTEVTFMSEQLVEVYAMWFNPQNAHRMQTYFKNVTPLITGKGNRYDVKFALNLKSVPYGDDTYQPESFGVALWKSKASNDHFFNSAGYKKVKHDKEAALSRIDVWHGKIVIN